MTNYTILQQNTLDGLSETAGCLYFNLLDVFQGHTESGERRAFLAACAYDNNAGSTLDYILKFGLRHPRDQAKPFPDEVRQELSKFFADRWQHNCMDKEA